VFLPGFLFSFFGHGHVHFEKPAAQRDIVFTPSVSQKSEMSDPDITVRQDMKVESPYELIGFESHDLLSITICIIAPSEGNLSVMKYEDAVIADGDPVGVSSQVLKNPIDSGKGRLAIDDPFFVIKPSSEDLKFSWSLKMADTAGEDQLCKTISKR
jgi:hypothetical protein